ncbi:SGNH/GDSL hydrolase family protein [Myxococcus sp. K15C18031901]|uniref:SGNH/GDSL hydrolase family protein n=1 Tax=Myxococcus dinghuensis TaxID=2906761 RepID=UPI0020A72B8F|nr:SGNH/GDSL hydrolase family protein [Myxococcus dinghuensis]MCP3099273.1 SGNH/GDSL hydrolase family protein [Myxococcus dinghuensis]
MQRQDMSRLVQRTRGVFFQVLAVAGLLLASYCEGQSILGANPPHWLPAFTAPLHPSASSASPDTLAGPSFRNQTVRMFVRPTLVGPRVRLVLSNQYGTQPLRLESVRVALRVSGATIDPTTDREVRFGGGTSVSIPPGRTATSDAVELAVDGQRDVAVSLYFLERSGAVSWHLQGAHPTYLSTAGNHAAEATFEPALITRSLYFLAALHVDAATNAALVVTFGDSITDGAGTTEDTERSWPARLAQRLAARGGRPVGVLNAGLAGNRLLTDGYGPKGLHRFERDVLAQRGVAAVILLEGINDIGQSGPGAAQVDAARIISAYEQLIQRARAQGLKVYGGTLTPMKHHAYFTPEHEAKREAVNQWIRGAGAFDAVIDFEAAVRDPDDPEAMRPELTADGLHPNDAGAARMADAVDLRLLE